MDIFIEQFEHLKRPYIETEKYGSKNLTLLYFSEFGYCY